MEFSVWLSFVGTVLILAFTPGPSVLLATANSMNHGINKTFGTIFGDLTANLCQIILASAGLATIVIASGELFQIIKWCGVAYLIYMGVSKFFNLSRLKVKSESTEKSFMKLFTEGFLMSAANPKAIVFFAALFPLFINENQSIIPQIAILATTFLTIDFLSLFIFARFALKLKGILENQHKMHLQNRIVGVLLILSGVMLSMVKRVNQ